MKAIFIRDMRKKDICSKMFVITVNFNFMQHNEI